MLAKITDNHFIYLDQVTQGSEESLVKWFSVRDPRAYYLKSDWDGYYRRYNAVKQRLALPFLAELIRCCKANQIPLQIVDERPAPKYPAPQPEQITADLLFNLKLEDYQVRALRTCCREEIGLISASTGSGKTELMCGLVKMFRCPTVIITEQIVVLEQIVERLAVRDVVHNDDIGVFCHGHMPEGNLVIVGSIQSLSSPTKPKLSDVKITKRAVLQRCKEWILKRTQSESNQPILYHIFPRKLADALYESPGGLNKLSGVYFGLLREFCLSLQYERLLKWYKTRIQKAREIQGMVNKCELLLVDECDLSTANNYTTLFRKHFQGRRRYGFSATPTDPKKPVQNLLIKENLGSVISETLRDEVQSAGRIIPIKFFMFVVGPDERNDSRTYDIALKEDIIENNAFHDIVAKIPESFPRDGTLILVDTSPIEPLGAALEQRIEGSKFIFGNTPKKQRREYIELFERRELTCLIGSKILKRGLDLDGGVENLVIIGGGAKWSDFDQKVGRAVRRNKRGWARVFGFFFLTNRYLYKHSRENLKALVSMGYEAKVFSGGTEIDGEKFIRSNYRQPKSVRAQRNPT